MVRPLPPSPHTPTHPLTHLPIQFALIIVRVSKGISSDQATAHTTKPMSFAIPVRHNTTDLSSRQAYSFGSTTADNEREAEILKDSFALKTFGPGDSSQKLEC